MFQHAVVIELAEVLDFGDAALVVAEVVLLEAEGDGFDDGVDDTDDESRVVAVEGAEEDGQEVDVAVLDFAGLGKDLVKDGDDLLLGETRGRGERC